MAIFDTIARLREEREKGTAAPAVGMGSTIARLRAQRDAGPAVELPREKPWYEKAVETFETKPYLGSLVKTARAVGEVGESLLDKEGWQAAFSEQKKMLADPMEYASKHPYATGRENMGKIIADWAKVGESPRVKANIRRYQKEMGRPNLTLDEAVFAKDYQMHVKDPTWTALKAATAKGVGVLGEILVYQRLFGGVGKGLGVAAERGAVGRGAKALEAFGRREALGKGVVPAAKRFASRGVQAMSQRGGVLPAAGEAAAVGMGWIGLDAANQVLLSGGTPEEARNAGLKAAPLGLAFVPFEFGLGGLMGGAVAVTAARAYAKDALISRGAKVLAKSKFRTREEMYGLLESAGIKGKAAKKVEGALQGILKKKFAQAQVSPEYRAYFNLIRERGTHLTPAEIQAALKTKMSTRELLEMEAIRRLDLRAREAAGTQDILAAAERRGVAGSKLEPGYVEPRPGARVEVVGKRTVPREGRVVPEAERVGMRQLEKRGIVTERHPRSELHMMQVRGKPQVVTPFQEQAFKARVIAEKGVEPAEKSLLPGAKGFGAKDEPVGAIRKALQKIGAALKINRRLGGGVIGRYHPQGKGKVRGALVELKDPTDFRTAFHEVGHHLRRMAKVLPQTKEIYRDIESSLSALSNRVYSRVQQLADTGVREARQAREIARVSGRKINVESQVDEGMAEAYALYKSQPDRLRAHFPDVHKMISELEKALPEAARKDLESLGVMWRSRFGETLPKKKPTVLTEQMLTKGRPSRGISDDAVRAGGLAGNLKGVAPINRQLLKQSGLVRKGGQSISKLKSQMEAMGYNTGDSVAEFAERLVADRSAAQAGHRFSGREVPKQVQIARAAEDLGAPKGKVELATGYTKAEAATAPVTKLSKELQSTPPKKQIELIGMTGRQADDLAVTRPAPKGREVEVAMQHGLSEGEAKAVAGAVKKGGSPQKVTEEALIAVQETSPLPGQTLLTKSGSELMITYGPKDLGPMQRRLVGLQSVASQHREGRAVYNTAFEAEQWHQNLSHEFREGFIERFGKMPEADKKSVKRVFDLEDAANKPLTEAQLAKEGITGEKKALYDWEKKINKFVFEHEQAKGNWLYRIRNKRGRQVAKFKDKAEAEARLAELQAKRPKEGYNLSSPRDPEAVYGRTWTGRYRVHDAETGKFINKKQSYGEAVKEAEAILARNPDRQIMIDTGVEMPMEVIDEMGVGAAKGYADEISKGLGKVRINKNNLAQHKGQKFWPNRMQRHSGLQTYEQDPVKNLSRYYQSYLRSEALSRVNKATTRVIEGLEGRKPNLKKYLEAWKDWMNGETHGVDVVADFAMKWTGMTKMLGKGEAYVARKRLMRNLSWYGAVSKLFNFYSPFINLSQIVTNTSVKIGDRYAMRGFKESVNTWLKKGDWKKNLEVLDYLNLTKDTKFGKAGELVEFAGGTKKGLGDYALYMFQKSEQTNRWVTGLGGYRYAREQLGRSHEAAKEYARWLVDTTQYNYSQWAAPPLLRADTSNVLFQFKKFPWLSMEFFWKLSAKEKANYAARMLAISGTKAVPLVAGVSAAAASIAGVDPIEWFESTYPRLAAGVPGLAAKTSVGASAGGHDFIPQQFEDLMGPVARAVYLGGKGLAKNDDLDLIRASRDLEPTMTRKIRRVVDELRTGRIKTMHGDKMMDLTPGEAWMRFWGPAPTRVEREYSTLQAEKSRSKVGGTRRQRIIHDAAERVMAGERPQVSQEDRQYFAGSKDFSRALKARLLALRYSKRHRQLRRTGRYRRKEAAGFLEERGGLR